MAKIEIRSKDRKRSGKIIPGTASGMMAEITRDSIHITGNYFNQEVDITFRVGDVVEYDAYNLRYLGTIEKITEKRITIQPRYSKGRRSMDLYSFAWRNYNFNLDEANRENAETSMYI